MPHSVLIVQARLGSTRLPGKVLMALAGDTVLGQCLRRCRAVPGIDGVVCAVPEGRQDDPVAAEAERCGVLVVRGPAADVLRRYRIAAENTGAEMVMRVTSDCPLIDPRLCGRLLALRRETGVDYACNNMPPSWPHGLDAEVFTAAALRQADETATEPFDREHVTPWLRRTLRTANLAHDGGDLSHHRWTLDYPEDYAFLSALFHHLPAAPAQPSMSEVLAVLRDHPELSAINAARRGTRAVAS
jgi:glutamate-1-semialdehyde 2,1-aminomutase/spore coat polysaccharide biosynthesis protein SpsF